MYSTILQFFEETVLKYPDKAAYVDAKGEISFDELMHTGQKIGSYISELVVPHNPIVVYMDKGTYNICAFLGAVYAGCFYVPIDAKMPIERVNLILNTLHPSLIIYDDVTSKMNDLLDSECEKTHYDEIVSYKIDFDRLDKIRLNSKNTDLLYVLFTSGSTGIPKGVTISHAAVIDFVEWICSTYHLDETITLCSQAPFYFDASVPDLYIPLKVGATLYIPPTSYYTFPKKILQYIETNKINTLVWVPSALCNVVNCRAFEVCVPESIRLVIFCGEVMPCKHLNVWRKYLPDVLYVNMYGPTEATYACMYYNIDREYRDDEVLPLGMACENSEILLLTEDGRVANVNETGEICILGQCLSSGYYNNSEKTNVSFVQNPINNNWNEKMYRTGDLAYVNEQGNMIFAGRKDFQIKRLGHRIELGEIENAILAVKGIENACCIFDENKSEIIVVYAGDVSKEQLGDNMAKRLPQYMMPSRFENVKTMPMNINGKIDRVKLKKEYIQ